MDCIRYRSDPLNRTYKWLLKNGGRYYYYYYYRKLLYLSIYTTRKHTTKYLVTVAPNGIGRVSSWNLLRIFGVPSCLSGLRLLQRGFSVKWRQGRLYGIVRPPNNNRDGNSEGGIGDTWNGEKREKWSVSVEAGQDFFSSFVSIVGKKVSPENEFWAAFFVLFFSYMIKYHSILQ